MLCSLAATVLLAASGDAQQPYGAGIRRPAVQNTAGNPPVPAVGYQSVPRQAATFATPYPSRPTPGPVRTVYDQPAARPTAAPPSGNAAQPARAARPGGAAAPGAAGQVMYFHKAEGALVPDGMADNASLAMAAHMEPAPGAGVPDVPAVSPGVPLPVIAPMTVIEKPVPAPAFTPVLPPSQPFNTSAPAPALNPKETSANQVPPRIVQPPPVRDPDVDVTQLPPRAAIFVIYDDAALEGIIYQSIAKQLNKTPEDLRKTSPFPVLKPTVPPGTPYVSKTVNLPPGQMVYEPGFVIHHRLHFEEKNSERYGWDLGLATPFVSTISFYKNVMLWPSSLASSLVVGTMDTNAGKCLPGSPTPYYLYPQGLTITGGVAEGLVITGLSFVIP